MRIGGREVTFTRLATGEPRAQELNPRGPRASLEPGIQGLAQGLGAAAVTAQQVEEDRLARARYGALERWSATQGEFQRRYDELAQQAPADGEGFEATVAQEWERAQGAFFNSLDPRLRDEFQVRAQETRQTFLTAANGLARQAAAGFALDKLGERVESAKTRVYAGEISFEQAEAELLPFLAAAPISPADRTKVAREMLRGVSMATVLGQLKAAGRSAQVIPFSQDANAWADTVIAQIESGNNPATPDSSAGAAGVMQVMPGTGGDIARELGDTAFPHDGTDEEKRAYLRNEEVSRRYGRHYWNAMLQRYDGDVELALVAYNAGPGRADEYRAAGRDPSVLPEETQGYLDKAFRAAGVKNPQLAFTMTGLMEHLKFEDRLELETLIETQNDALVAEAEAERQKAAQAATDAMVETVRAMGRSVLLGDLSGADAQADVEAQLAAIPELTETERANNLAKFRAEIQGAEKMAMRLRRVFADPDVSEFVQLYLETGDNDQIAYSDLVAAAVEEASALSQDATRAKQEAAAAEEQRVEIAKQMLIDGASLDDARGLWPEGRPPADTRLALERLYEDRNAEMLATADAIEAANRGDPLTKDQSIALGRVFDDVVKAMREGEVEVEGQRVGREEYFSARVIPLWQQTGELPANVKSQFQAMISSPDWRDREFALRMGDQMLAANSRRFGAEMGEDIERDVLLYRTVSRALPGDETRAMMSAVLDPNVARTQREQAKAAQETDTYTEMTPEAVARIYDSTFAFLPGVARQEFVNGGHSIAALSKWQSLYTHFYSRMGDESKAAELATDMLSRTFGPSQGQGLVPYPIEGRVKPVGGSLGWIDAQAREDLAAAGVTVPEDAQLMFVAEPTAGDRAAKGLPVAYSILVKRRDGGLWEIADGLPLWEPDQGRAAEAFAAKRQELFGTQAVSDDMAAQAVRREEQMREVEAGQVPEDLRKELFDLRIEATPREAKRYLEGLRSLREAPGTTSLRESWLGEGLSDSSFMRWLRRNRPQAQRPYRGLNPVAPRFREETDAVR